MPALYIAYYARIPTQKNPGRYHTALIALPLPKSIIPFFTYSLSLPATKYHVVNVPVLDETGKGRVSWQFRVERDAAAAKATSLRLKLIALMSVGVIEEEQTLEEVVRSVDVPKYADERPEWRCTTWVFEALKVRFRSSLLIYIHSCQLGHA